MEPLEPVEHQVQRELELVVAAAAHGRTLLLGRGSRGHLEDVRSLAGWVINVAVVEWALRRRPTYPARTTIRPAPTLSRG